MGWTRCVRCKKLQCDFVARTFALIAPVSPRFAPSLMQLRNDPKCTQTLRDAPKHEFRVQRSGFGAFVVEKIQHDFVARTFALIAPVHPILHQVSCSYETIPNAPKHYEWHQNMSLGSNELDQVRSLRKITT